MVITSSGLSSISRRFPLSPEAMSTTLINGLIIAVTDITTRKTISGNMQKWAITIVDTRFTKADATGTCIGFLSPCACYEFKCGVTYSQTDLMPFLQLNTDLVHQVWIGPSLTSKSDAFIVKFAASSAVCGEFATLGDSIHFDGLRRLGVTRIGTQLTINSNWKWGGEFITGLMEYHIDPQGRRMAIRDDPDTGWWCVGDGTHYWNGGAAYDYAGLVNFSANGTVIYNS
ncbi:hypothetical protein K504DRAFT_500204 [Pleomassaria siparia CBS 279.74]|uniref:Uncharacterized protein n=1 Tax=Pleomassaria siparia CBS 279.74 TaxID=1314801 RepID=A0A6G1KGK6_9PLEO|nr:hypothetical protein K504DRAFT_500204 [Pleomassaria siparia CBS 279.74]